MSGHGSPSTRPATGGRTASGFRRWLVVGTTGVVTLALFGAAASAGGNDPDAGAPRAGAPTTPPADTAPDETASDESAPDETGPDGDVATQPPDGLGGDPELDALAQRCADRDLLACDHLFLQSPVGSDYEHYGDTCGGRQDAGTENYCALGTGGDPTPSTDPIGPATTEAAASDEPVPPENLGSDSALDALALDCYVGDMAACDDLYLQSDEGSEYRIYGDTCAGRQPELTGRLCTSLEDPVPGTGPVASGPESTAVDTVAPGTTPPGVVPPATEEPTGLGDDPALDAFAQACHAGDMNACDELYSRSEAGTEYRRYGDTCAGRQPEDTGVWCRTAFGEGTSTTVTPAPSTAPPTAPPLTVPVLPTLPLPSVPLPSVPLPSTPVPTMPLPTEPVPSVPLPTAPLPSAPLPTAPLPTAPLPTAPLPTAPLPTGPLPTGPLPTGPLPTGAVPSLPTTTVPLGIPAPTMLPTGLGVDPALDALAQACYDGEMAVCDELYRASDADDELGYREFADTCAGRQPVGTGRWCEAAFPLTGATVPVPGATTIPGVTVPAPTATLPGPAAPGIPPATQQPVGLGADPTLDALAQRCFDGDMQACDELFLQSELGTPYHDYGDTCAGRQPAGTYTYCRVAFPATQP